MIIHYDEYLQLQLYLSGFSTLGLAVNLRSANFTRLTARAPLTLLLAIAGAHTRAL